MARIDDPVPIPDAAVTDDAVLRPVMWMFIAVLVTFLTTRMITRRIRAKQRAQQSGESGGLLGNISVGGIHVHHQVFGILLMTGSGIAVFATSPDGTGLNICAAIFGIGISLAFDEFALWLHLDDVYWSDEGRQSIDAIFVLLAVIGILIGGVDFVTGAAGTAAWWSSVISLLITLALVVICVLKGKVMLGLIGALLSPLAIVGAIRLGKPNSWWAKRFYAQRRPKRLARSQRRFGDRYNARWNRVRDFFGGKPDEEPAGPVA